MSTLKLILAFAPWIALKIIAGPSLIRLDIAIIVALLLSIGLAIAKIHKGFIMVGGILFFGFALVAVVGLQNMWAISRMAILATGTLALLSWLSILIKQPFTMSYAKEHVPKEQWNTPKFIQINYLITFIWALVFTFNCLLNVFKFYQLFNSLWLYEILEYVLIVSGILFTQHYSKPRANLKTKAQI
ncbi:MAG: hypothetical protein ABH859_07950 [Pseudomonadota bacterium]